MTSVLSQFVLLADVGDMITVVITIFIVFASLLSYLKDKLQAAKPADRGQPGRPPARREPGLQREIDRFLQEVSGKSPKRAPAEAIEIVEVEPTAARRKPPTLAQQQAEKRAEKQAQSQARRRPGSAIADREGPGSTDLGSGVRKHVSEHMAKGRVATSVEEHLSHDVDKSVAEHLGTFSGSRVSTTTPRQRASMDPNQIVKLLSSPGGIQQAVILSEILSRPTTRHR